MEVSALKYSAGIGLHGRSPLLRLQSDERLIALMRRGNTASFEVLVSRYETRLLAFCRHLLSSREDAEDVLQEVMAAAFNAILADERPINVRPWLYRIARNRSLNHLRRAQAIGVDSMDTHFSDHGASTADKVHEREEFRLLVGDIHELPETQKTALVLREMDALSYEQIAEAMETTVSSVKSLLVRARVSLAEAAEARLLSCDEVRIELGEVAEGLRRRPTPLVRRHLRSCKRCTVFRGQLRQTNRALAALMPIGPFVILKKLAIFHLGHSAAGGASSAGSAGVAGAGAAGAGASAAGMGVAGAGATAGGTALAGSGGFISAGLSAIATKAAAGLAAAALVTAGAVEADHSGPVHHAATENVAAAPIAAPQATVAPLAARAEPRSTTVVSHKSATPADTKSTPDSAKPAARTAKATPTTSTPVPTKTTKTPTSTQTTPGRDQTQSDPTVLQPSGGDGSWGSSSSAPTPPPSTASPSSSSPDQSSSSAPPAGSGSPDTGTSTTPSGGSSSGSPTVSTPTGTTIGSTAPGTTTSTTPTASTSTSLLPGSDTTGPSSLEGAPLPLATSR
ncbi:MAG TPA: RNA polymerase sigma factor [Solirubrobacteraceae bacterium]